MTTKTLDFTALFDAYRQAFAPVIAAQQSGLNTMERLARYQFAVAGDYLDWTLSHIKTSAEQKSVSDLISQQTALNTSFSDRLKARAEELTQIASESQGTATKWFEEARAKVAATAATAAKAA